MNKKIIEFLEESNNIEDVWDKKSLEQAKAAWKYLIAQDKLTIENVLGTHRILMQDHLSHEYKGKFRKEAVYIGGKEAIPYTKMSEKIKIWCDNVNFRMEYWKESHIAFEHIHPFIDGNGRTGRIFLNWQRVKQGLEVLVIKEKEKYNYYKWFK